VEESGRRRLDLESLVRDDAPPDDLIDLDEAISQLLSVDVRASELVKLRIFARLSLDPDHPDTLATRTHLAEAYQAAGRTSLAEPILLDSLERARKQFGSADPRTAGAMAQLGTNLIQQDK
jgi:hypothetical protein